MTKTEIVDKNDISRPTTPIIKRLEYSPETLEELDKLNHPTLSETTKKLIRRRLLGSIKHCCICQALPEYEVTYPLDNATKIERYCSECFNKRGETERKFLDPNDYFVLVDKLPRST